MDHHSVSGILLLSLCLTYLATCNSHSYDQLDSFTDSLLREVMNRMGGELDVSMDDYLSPSQPKQELPSRVAKEFDGHSFRTRHDGLLGREPSIRDQEYLEHNSLFGHQYMQGGAGEGYQHLKPDGSMKNVQVVKTDGVLPAYCNPPNPCPLGYSADHVTTAERWILMDSEMHPLSAKISVTCNSVYLYVGDDGCLENFVNTAAFSREYQASQECMCDTEHMFHCPGSTRETEIDALARSIQNEGIMDSTLHRLVQDIHIKGEHKNLVAKKFFSHKPPNPFLEGEKLPVVAKKAPKHFQK